jgi:hypothetical protein
MSTKIDCIIYLKSKLESEFTKLATGETPNLPAAQKVQSIALTAENISDGYFAKIEPFFEPVSPKFILVLNEGIISGSSSVADFDEYVALLVSALTAVLASRDSQSSRETLPRQRNFWMQRREQKKSA